MSRIGRKPIPIPNKVQVTIDGSAVTVKGPKGELHHEFPPDIGIQQEGTQVLVSRPTDQQHHRALHGMTRALINNMVTGVTAGFSKTLEIVGTGYRAQQDGKKVVLALGFSHPIVFDPPEGITVKVESPTRVSVSGIDKALVGQVAADIRGFRPPEPYKGKGVKYEGEYIRRKAGKAAGSA